ncbi:MAG TPA: 30S ribosomal protein S5, partial [Synergistaceae bacterium]|nr:30S ribosomal protein S5 [Synergistaceae bacterium]
MVKNKVDAKELELTERVVAINRVSKVVKGGKRFKFSVLVVVGDGDRYVGVGMGKAKEISEAVRKGIDKAGKNLHELKKIGNTIPHPV